MRKAVLVSAMLLISGHAVPAQSARPHAASTAHVVVLVNGDNRIDLLGDGTPSNVRVAWRSNNNAHGSSSVGFYLLARSDVERRRLWQIVPFFGGLGDGTTGQELFRTIEGADCTLGDLRVVPQVHHAVDVVIATRALGESFADPAEVRFEYYELVKNVDGTPGWPTFYFRHTRSRVAQRKYCDVNVAFDRELGLGLKGLGHGEASR